MGWDPAEAELQAAEEAARGEDGDDFRSGDWDELYGEGKDWREPGEGSVFEDHLGIEGDE